MQSSAVSAGTSGSGSVVVDWMAGPMSDVVADAVTSIVQQAISAPAIVISRMSVPSPSTAMASKKRFVLQTPNVSDIPSSIASSDSENAMKKMKLAYMQSNKHGEQQQHQADTQIKSKSDKDNILKLRKLKSMLIRSGLFSDVLLNTDGTSLILY